MQFYKKKLDEESKNVQFNAKLKSSRCSIFHMRTFKPTALQSDWLSLKNSVFRLVNRRCTYLTTKFLKISLGLVDLRLKSFSSYRTFFISIFRYCDINKAMDTALEVVRLIMEYFGLERDALIGVSL